MSGTTSGLTDDILKRLKGEAGASPVFLPDLRIWHAWHSERRTLPLSNPKATFSETCRELGVPAWLPVKVWKSESENAVVATIDSTDERSRSITAGGRTLTSRWSIGPDGDWWQTEYPAKTAEDLKVILNYVEGRRLVADTSELDSLARDVGSEGLVALELPSQPFAWLMLEILGWSEGLMLLMDAMDTVAAIVETATSGEGLRDRGEGAFYAFHVKWNPQGDRLMLVLRFKPTGGGGMQHDVITMKADGSDIHVAIPQAEWGKGGHHPNWCPDGETVLINIKADTQTLRLVSARYDGSSFGVVSDSILASGHPTLHPDGRHVLTDVYLHESLAFGDGTTPIRWMDLQTHTVKDIIRINNDPPFPGPKRELRIDPHPAWDQSFTRIAFNGCEKGVRRVYVADLSALL